MPAQLKLFQRRSWLLKSTLSAPPERSHLSRDHGSSGEPEGIGSGGEIDWGSPRWKAKPLKAEPTGTRGRLQAHYTD